MNKTELVAKLSENSSESKASCMRVLDSFIHVVQKELKAGGDVRLVGFGTFFVSKRAAMKGRNPRTGATINIPASKRPKFKAGKQFTDAVN